MKNLMVTGAVVLLLCVGGTRAEAQGVASSFDQLSVLVKPGDKITVVDLAGGRAEARIGMLSRDTLTLVTPAGPRDVGEADVAEIRQRRADSLKNGAIIGAAAGGSGMALVVLVTSMSDGGDLSPAGAVTAIVVVTGIGAAAGVGLDALITRGQVIYRKPPAGNRFSVSPLVGRGRRGAAVTLTF